MRTNDTSAAHGAHTAPSFTARHFQLTRFPHTHTHRSHQGHADDGTVFIERGRRVKRDIEPNGHWNIAGANVRIALAARYGVAAGLRREAAWFRVKL